MNIKTGGKILSYKNLPLEAQLAIYQYMAVEGSAWNYFGNPSKESISQAVAEYGDIKFGYKIVPMKDLINEIMTRKESDIYEDFSTFDEYHQWYTGGVTPPKESTIWPVILSSNIFEVLEDGWHRFHSYYAQGLKEIPVIWYP
jgi:hypothetical protein